MVWLTFHMWLLLLGAFLLGLLFGWWIWRERQSAIQTADTSSSVAPLKSATPIESQSGASQSGTHPNNLVSPSAQTAQKPTNEGKKPRTYENALNGPADDLKKIRGIGPGIEKLLHSLGIFYYEQISSWGDDEITWVDNKLQFPGRIIRENWVDQAKTLGAGGQTEFAQRYDKGETPSSYVGNDKKDDS